jgi:hypothetical protein
MIHQIYQRICQKLGFNPYLGPDVCLQKDNLELFRNFLFHPSPNSQSVHKSDTQMKGIHQMPNANPF